MIRQTDLLRTGTLTVGDAFLCFRLANVASEFLPDVIFDLGGKRSSFAGGILAIGLV